MSRRILSSLRIRAFSGAALPPVLLVFFSLLIYANSLPNGFVFDDKIIIERNPLLRGAGGIPQLFVTPYWAGEGRFNRLYRPVTSATFALNYLVGKSDPWGFHLANALLHGFVAVLLWALLVDLFGFKSLALFAALLFVVHPVQTEAVAGLVGRSEILSALFLLVALWLDRRGGRRPGYGRWPPFAASLAFFFLALLSKENALAYPILLLLTDRVVGRPAEVSPRRRLGEIGMTLGVTAVYLFLRVRVLGSLMEGGPIPEVDNLLAHASPAKRVLTALALSAKYLGLFLCPVRLSADYSAPQVLPIRGFSDLRLWLGVGVAAGLVALLFWSRHRLPPLSWGVGFAIASFFLVSNIPFPIGTIFAERLLYLPSAGLCTAVAVTLVAASLTRPWTTRILFAAVLALCSVRTWARNRDWRDDFSLFQSAARVSDRSAKVQYNLGNAYRRRGDLTRAAESYRTCLDRYPGFGPAKRNLGVVLVDLGRAGEAIDLFQEALARNPESPSLHNNLGNAYRALGRVGEAEVQYRRAIELDASSADPHNNLGILFQEREEPGRAGEEYREAIRLEPDRVELRVNLGNLLLLQGDFMSAEEAFREAEQKNPALPEPHRGLGEALLDQGRANEAESELQRSLSLDPKQWEAPALLGYLYQQRGDRNRALALYHQSLLVKPNQRELHRNLGILYGAMPDGRGRALEHFRRFLALNPPETEASEARKAISRLEEE